MRYNDWDQRQLDIAYTEHMDSVERDRLRESPFARVRIKQLESAVGIIAETLRSRNANDPLLAVIDRVLAWR